MLDPLSVKPQKILVVGEDDSLLAEGKGDVVLVIGSKEPHIGRCGDIDTASAKSGGNLVVYMLVKMKPNRHGRPCL